MAALTGFAFPLALDGEGGLQLASEAEYVRGLILSYVSIYKGERLGLPNYGLPARLFESYNAFGFIAKEVEAELVRAIPEADFAVTSQLNDDGDGVIIILWAYKGVDQQALNFLVTIDNPTPT